MHRVTLEDVARAAGVSAATASRALSGRGPASPATRSRVGSAARDLGYVPNAAARALATRGGPRVAVAVGGVTADVLADQYVGRVVAAAAGVAGAHEAGVSLHWLPLDDPGALARLGENRAIGAVLVVNPTQELLAAAPRSLRGRVAAIGVGTREVAAFDVDNAGGTARVVEHLLGGGRRRVAMVSGVGWLPCVQRAVGAYARVVEEAGCPVRVVPGDFSAVRGEEAAVEIMRRWPDTDAVYALGDLSALGVLGALRRAGVDVPGDVAVAGFDDLPVASLGALTTSTNPVEEIAAGAVSAVLEGRARRPVELFPSVLVVRETG